MLQGVWQRPGFYLSDASSIASPTPSGDNHKCLQILPSVPWGKDPNDQDPLL